MEIPSLIAGVAGEYFVAAELSRRGIIASISLRNTRGIDILATDADGTRSITVQCKTSQKGKAEWILNEKVESFTAPNHYYVFVLLRGTDERPSFHIVPSHQVAEAVRQDHHRWLATPGRSGRQHQDNPVRKFRDLAGTYMERWDLLGFEQPKPVTTPNSSSPS